MRAVSPRLNFARNTEEAFNFYKSFFGGKFRVEKALSYSEVWKTSQN